MLEFIRNHSKSMVLKFLLGILSLTFIFCFGMFDVINKIVGNDYVVKIGNVKITPTMFRIEKAKKLALLRNYKENIDESAESLKILHQIIWENVIDVVSNDFGIIVSDDTIMHYIRNMHYFRDKKTNIFNTTMFRNFLRSIQSSEEMFVEFSKKDVKTELIKAPTKYVCVADELEMYTNASLERRSVDYIVFQPANFTFNSNIKESELEEFYNKNQDKFMAEETRSFKVVYFLESDLRKKIKVTDEEVKDAYETSIDREERSLSEMKKELTENIFNEKLQNEINELSRNIEDAVIVGTNIDDIVKQYSLNVVNAKDIDENDSKNSVDLAYKKDLLTVAFSTEEKAGSSFSEALDKSGNKVLWLVYVDSILPKHPKEFKTIIEDVKKIYILSKKRDLAQKEANKWLELVNSGKKTVANIASECHLNYNSTVFFNREGEILEKIIDKFIPKIFNEAFEKDQGCGGIKEIDDGFALYSVKSIAHDKPKDDKALLEIQKNLIYGRSEDVFQQIISHFSKKAKININYNKLKEINNVIPPIDAEGGIF